MPTLTMRHTGFRALVMPVLPMVADTTAVQALDGVRIHTEPGRVVAETVSAAMLGMCVRPLENAPAGFDVLIPAVDVPWRVSKFSNVSIEQTPHGTVVVSWFNQGGVMAISEYDVLDSTRFPNLKTKIRKALEVTDRARFANMTADQLKAFAVCAERVNNVNEAPLVIHPGATVHDMTLVTCGDHFAGMAAASSNIRQQPTRTKLRMVNPPGGDPIELWRTQLSTPEGE